MIITSFMIKILFTLRGAMLDVRGVLIYLPSYEEKALAFDSNILSMCVWGPSFKKKKKEVRFENNIGELNRTAISLISYNR